METKTPREVIAAQLADFFDLEEVKWKPQATKGDRAMAIAYIDARCVMDRLDEVLGLGNWEATYRPCGESIVCSLRIRIDGEWVTHEDVGSLSEQPDDGDKLKAAFSDALKRAAVHIGIGRYLYRLPNQWVPYDQSKRRFAEQPRLPAWAIPREKDPADNPVERERVKVSMILKQQFIAKLQSAKTVADIETIGVSMGTPETKASILATDRAEMVDEYRKARQRLRGNEVATAPKS